MTTNLNQLAAIISFISVLSSCNGQTGSDKVGGNCEGCEAIYEYGDRYLNAVDTLPGFRSLPDAMKLEGTVYKKDGQTPAAGVILYVYQTNEKGKYPSRPDSRGWESRHGYIRGWLKTDENGRYTIYSSRPASYPNSTIPQHVHVTVKEPNLNEYYVEDFFFDDDPFLDRMNIRDRKRPRGGSGVIKLVREGDLLVGRRDIILGLHIPNYPD